MPKSIQRYIYPAGSAWIIRKKKVNYGRFKTIEEAVQRRNQLYELHPDFKIQNKTQNKKQKNIIFEENSFDDPMKLFTGSIEEELYGQSYTGQVPKVIEQPKVTDQVPKVTEQPKVIEETIDQEQINIYIKELENCMESLKQSDIQIKTNLQKILQSNNLITKLTNEFQMLEEQRINLFNKYNF